MEVLEKEAIAAMMRFLEASRRSNDSAMNYSRGNTVAIKEQGCCLEKRNGK